MMPICWLKRKVLGQLAKALARLNPLQSLLVGGVLNRLASLGSIAGGIAAIRLFSCDNDVHVLRPGGQRDMTATLRWLR